MSSRRFAALRSVARRNGASYLVLALFVLGQLATALHETQVPHRVCAEHGELEHGDEGGPLALSAHERDAAPALERAPANEHADDHELCPLAAFTHTRARAVEPALPSACLPARVELTAPRASARVRHDPIELLLQAPQLPPPASSATSSLA